MGATSSTGGNSYFINPLLMSMLGIVVTAIAIIMYHCLLVKYCIGRRASSATAAQPSKRPAGLDQKVLKTIPIVAFSTVKHDMDDQLDIECAVCLGELEDEDMVRLIPNCKHAFHAACIDQWFASHDTCPLCRSPIQKQTNKPAVDSDRRRVTVESITTATDSAGEQAPSPREQTSPPPPQETCSQIKRSVSVNGEMCSNFKRSGSVDLSSVVVINLEMDSFTRDSSSSSSSLGCGVESGSGSRSEPSSVAHFDRVSSAKWLCRSLSRLQMGKGTNTAILPI